VIWGVVLAGGRSTRLGSEKAALEIDGRPLLHHVVSALDPQVSALAINASPNRWAARFAAGAGLPLLTDAPGDPDGPLSGVKAGLAWAAAGGAELLATAPCDTPFLPHDLVPRLVGVLTEDAGAVVARTADGLQSLCAIWRCDRLDVLETALAEGRHPAIREMFAILGAVEVGFDDARAFHNINTPEDLARARG
jgi:molybdopterin-guanine dinucleotide biosynthesis protein A